MTVEQVEPAGIGLLPDRSALRAAVAAHLPELAGLPVRLSAGRTVARVGDRAEVAFAADRPAADRLWHAAAVLRALADGPVRPWLPELLGVNRDPVLLATAVADGARLTRALVSAAGPPGAELVGRELAELLAALHRPDVRAAAETALGCLPRPQPPATTAALRDRFTRFVPAAQRARLLGWCAWADQVLAEPAPLVFAHGDLHGSRQRWSPGARLHTVLDWGGAGLAEAEYDLRGIPLDGGMAVLRATVRHYQALTGRPLSTARAMAWHLRTVLGEALRCCEAGVPLPDGRAPADWVYDLTRRFASLAR